MRSKLCLKNSGPSQSLSNLTKGGIRIRAGAYCEPKTSQEVQAWILQEIEKAEKRGRLKKYLNIPEPKKPLPKVKRPAKTGDLSAFKIPKRSLYERRRDPSPVITKRKPK